ncbi:MAG: hypothetical protein IBX50_14090 [Marinospirillum sp.]|uniref:hypothetical protein n=1 Tax=Marinospirillum sp. TaxID=2183934 RepID=UPI0019E729CD|nr:hypothetical protein [Marinospirillum sp.]MBE0507818.1 hypothetical protein [Marinospirillum sp.]
MLKPMDKELTVQIHHPDRGWMKCATLHFDDRLELGPIGPVSIRYLDDYAMDDQHVAKLGTLGWPAAWMQVPLQLNERASFKSWPLFLMDMLPQGAAWDFCSTSIGLKGRSEANYLALTGHPKGVKAAIFLKNMAKAPIGNLRVRENLNGLSDSDFGHTPATYLTAQGYFFRFDNRVYVDGSFVPASRLLLDLSQVDALPVYPKPRLEALAQDLDFEASTVFAVDLPSGETIQATLQTEYTLPGDTRVKMKADSMEPLVYRQNRPADLPSIADLLDAAARIKPWKATGKLRVICDTGSFQLQMMDAAFKAHHESIMPQSIRTSNVRVLSLPRRTTPFTAPWRQRAVAAGLDGRRLLAISDYVNFSYSNDLWLIELLAHLAPLVLCGKHLVMDERFSDWLESLQDRGIASGWMPRVEGDSVQIESVPQGLKSHADGLLFFFSECYHSAGS